VIHLVVGLGNPGSGYARSRHNAGFGVVEVLARRLEGRWRRHGSSHVARVEWTGVPLVLAKPTTYMNLSGNAVSRLLGEFGLDLSHLILVHDDIDLPVGKVRARQRGGHGGHHGIRSVIEAVGSQAFRRGKVGVGRPASKEAVVDYVLTPLSAEEQAALDGAVERAADLVLTLVGDAVRGQSAKED